MLKNSLFFGLSALLVFAWSACAPRTAVPPVAMEDGVLAVAGFGQPAHDQVFLTSYRPVHPASLTQEVLDELDEILLELLADEPGRIILGPDATRQCQEMALSKVKIEGVSGLRYWLNVGRCVPADYLLVPQILEWKEREGTEWGVNEPAMVIMELTLLDVTGERVLRRYRFEEAQRSLSEDLLQARKFFRRGGKWLSTQELVVDGLREGLREMGL